MHNSMLLMFQIQNRVVQQSPKSNLEELNIPKKTQHNLQKQIALLPLVPLHHLTPPHLSLPVDSNH